MRDNVAVVAKTTAPVDLELIFSRALSRVMFSDISDGSAETRKNPSESVMEGQLQLLAEQLCTKVERRYRQRFSEQRERDRTETNRRLQQIKEEYHEKMDQIRRQYEREQKAAEDEVKEKEKALQQKFDIKSLDYVNQVEVNRKVLDNRYTEIRLMKEQLDVAQGDFKRKMAADLEMIKLEWERLQNRERDLAKISKEKSAAEALQTIAKLQDEVLIQTKLLETSEVRIAELHKKLVTPVPALAYDTASQSNEVELRKQNEQLRTELEFERRTKNVGAVSQQEVRNSLLKSEILERKNNELRIAASVLNEKLKTVISERNYLRDQLRKANERPPIAEKVKRKEKFSKRFELSDTDDDITSTGRSDEIEKIRRRIRNLDDIATELDATVDRYSHQFNEKYHSVEEEGDYDDYCRHRRSSGIKQSLDIEPTTVAQTKPARKQSPPETGVSEFAVRRTSPKKTKSPLELEYSTQSPKYEQPRQPILDRVRPKETVRQPSPPEEEQVTSNEPTSSLTQENPLFEDVDPVMAQYMKLVLQSRSEAVSQPQTSQPRQDDSTVEITEAGEVELEPRVADYDEDDIDW